MFDILLLEDHHSINMVNLCKSMVNLVKTRVIFGDESPSYTPTQVTGETSGEGALDAEVRQTEGNFQGPPWATDGLKKPEKLGIQL
jgi:hypothetical protein